MGFLVDRRTLVSMMAAGVASPFLQHAAAAQPAPKARNIVLVHGLFADGSCWSEVIARLQPKGLNVTSVQNPLTTLPEAVEAAQRALAMQQGPTVLVGHSFSGMIVTEAGVDPKVSALVYVASRAPDAGEDYTALAKQFPAPPASAGIVWSDDWGHSVKKPSCAISPATFLPTRRASFTPFRRHSNGRCLPARRPTRRGVQSRVGMPFPRKTGPSIQISNASWRSAWVRRRST
jgi:pimeloyl-ACP methyl ester carboxylesterase